METPDIADLIASIKLELGDAIKDVRPSKRLTDSPVCLIADDGDMDVNMERLLKRHGQLQQKMPRVLELNPNQHKLSKSLLIAPRVVKQHQTAYFRMLLICFWIRLELLMEKFLLIQPRLLADLVQ